MPSLAIKRQRKRKRTDTDGDPEFQVAPMVDVLLVLMLFFMAITSTEVLKKDPNLQLADAKNAKKDDHKKTSNEIEINIGWDGVKSEAQFTMDGVGYPSADAMQSIIATRHQQNPESFVLIRADKNVQYSNVSDLMNACANAGVSTVTFAVITGGGANKKPDAAPGAATSN